jgi:phenylpropionate dioxygenase-like ring-hydroxylating dioxygenase large terminal subunit
MTGSTLGNTHPALARCWHPVARSDEVSTQPQRVVVLGQPWVLYRTPTQVVAYADRCPHRRAPLSLGRCEGEVLRCAYHGWAFEPGGRCVEIPALGPDAVLPARARLQPAAGVVEQDGLVLLAPEDPIAAPPPIPEATDPTYLEGRLPSMAIRASAGLLADNFLDLAHFPFVHAATFGADEIRQVPPYEVTRQGWSFTATHAHRFANREDPAVGRGERPLLQTRRLTHRYHAPFHLVLRIDFLESGGANVIGFSIQPETPDRCRLYTTLWRNDLDGDPARMAEAVAFEVAVLEEDIAVQSAYDDLVLPLDGRDEVHTRADRITVELRRILADLVRQTEGPAEERDRPRVASTT